MKIELRAIEEQEKSIFLNVYQFYVHEMSFYFDKDLNESGQFSVDAAQFDKYWTEKHHWPYFILVEGNIAGFCLLRKYPDLDLRYDIEQFFVLNNYKRKSVGFSVFQMIVEQYTGLWKIRVMESNKPALGFWQSSIRKIFGIDPSPVCVNESGMDMHFLYFSNCLE